MNLHDTIARLRELLAKATPGEWAAGHFGTDSSCQCRYVLGETCSGSICDVSVDNGKLIADGGNDSPPANEAAANLQLIPAMKNALPQLLDALEARESEKPKEWWTVGEKTPCPDIAFLLWDKPSGEWLPVYVDYGSWTVCTDCSVIPMSKSDIYRKMPPAPAMHVPEVGFGNMPPAWVGEGKS